jgi:hypothetical protein
LIGQPFSQKTRDHFLPLLTSTAWWTGTQMALRQVFSQDDDFKESMFARQIAVMKGQAWNVVETLKQPDHGPLELTRRTRVCVWDDLVDVPVAIPMQAPTSEMQRRQTAEYDPDEEEMDIGAANSSQQIPEHDLLGLGSDLPNPNRFELSRGRTNGDIHKATDSFGSPATLNENDFARQNADGSYARSLDGWPALPARPNKHRKHGGSLSFRTPHVNTFGSDDLEGDLGYAAAEGMEGNQRKVIVERLEAVKSKNPVFTWC